MLGRLLRLLKSVGMHTAFPHRNALKTKGKVKQKFTLAMVA
jgi:hypothetical protein